MACPFHRCRSLVVYYGEDEAEYLYPEQRARKHIADETVRAAHPRARLAVEIADDLMAYPILSVADAERRYGRSNQAN